MNKFLCELFKRVDVEVWNLSCEALSCQPIAGWRAQQYIKDNKKERSNIVFESYGASINIYVILIFMTNYKIANNKFGHS